MPKGFLERLNVSTITINGVGGLATALFGLSALPEKLKLPQPYTSYVSWAITAVFFFIVLRAAILAVPLRSVLRNPDVFILRRELPQHLVGREEDLDRLQEKLNGAPLLFVEGESGVGKSALLRAGLAPKLTAGHRYLPIYVESLVGRDWAEGPWDAALPAFRAALDVKAPPPSRKPVAEAFHELLEAARETGRMPVLIIDQFDDYQLSHATRFLRAGTWLRAAELAAENPFWAALDAALAGSRLQLVIATRNDMSSGLEAVRFVAPQTYRVHKVAPKYLRELIERLSGSTNGSSGAIDAPLATWPDLRERLLDDLASRGAILPQQLKVALLGLPGLPRQQLTIAGYVAVGGVPGLEANWIETQIDRATRDSKLSTPDILRLLVALCEPDAVAKTRDLPLPALCEAAGLEDHTAVETALTALKDGKVVRPLVGTDRSESVWQLDHDYIAGVVDLANRRANRWELTLVEGRKAFAGASGVVRKWEALLPLRTQIQFFLDRSMRRFRYESGRAYALISLAKFAPAMLAALLVALGYHMIQTHTRNLELAARVSAGFDTEPELTETEAKNIINLSLSNITVARSVIRLMLDEPSTTATFYSHLKPLIAALDLAADGNWTTLTETADLFAKTARGSQGTPEVYVVAIKKVYVVAMLLAQAGRASEAATLLVEAMEAAMEVDTDGDVRVWLAAGLGALGDGVPPEKAALAADLLVASMKANKNDPSTLGRFAGGLNAFADRVPQHAIDQAATLLVTAMVADSDYHVGLSGLADGLTAIGEHVRPETAAILAPRLVAAMEAYKGSAEDFSKFADSFGAIAKRLPQPTSATLASRLGALMEAPNASALGRALGAIRDQVPQQTVDLTANHVVAAMEANKGNPDALSQLADGLGAIADRVPQETVGQAASRLVAAMDANKGDSNALILLAKDIGTIGDRVPQETVGQAASRLVAAMEANKGDSNVLVLLAKGLGAIEDRVPQETVGQAASRLVAAMEANENDIGALERLADGLGAIRNRVQQEMIGRAAARLVAAMHANKGNPDALFKLAYGLGAIADRVPQETVGLGVALIVAAMDSNKGDSNALVLLADSLGVIENRVQQETIGRAAARLVAAMEANENDIEALQRLAYGLVVIGDRVSKVDAQSLAVRLNALFPRCDITIECQMARITLHGVLSRERAIQLCYLAIRDPLVNESFILEARLASLIGSDVKYDKYGWYDKYDKHSDNPIAVWVWLRKQRSKARVDDASVRKELRELIQKRKAIVLPEIPGAAHRRLR